MLRVCGVTLDLDGVRILDGIDFEVEKGDFVAIIGPNGSGKTTLLRVVAKYLKPKYGTVYLNGRDVLSMGVKEIAKILGVVPQEFNFDLNFTVGEFVLTGRIPYMSGYGFENPGDYDVASESLEMVGCADLSDRLVRSLSGGEKQRVLIARALAQKPKVLLLDEPISHLDLNHQLEIMELLKKLSRKGITIISTFHDLNIAVQYCDKVVILKDGDVIACGGVEIVTPKIVREVFGVDVVIKKNPITGRMTIIPMKRRFKIKSRVHIICGAGTGSKLMSMIENGSTGVLNEFDPDWESAIGMGFDVVSEKPFLPISDEKHEENLRLIDRADHVVLTDLPFGFMNLRNLIASQYAGDLGKLIVIDRTPIEMRDFTGGKAKCIYKSLKGVFVKDEIEALRCLDSKVFNNFPRNHI